MIVEGPAGATNIGVVVISRAGEGGGGRLGPYPLPSCVPLFGYISYLGILVKFSNFS